LIVYICGVSSQSASFLRAFGCWFDL